MINHDSIILPKRAKDLVNLVFDRLTVLAPVGKNPHNRILWLCQCICGNTSVVSSSDLLSGHTSSCVCLRKEILSNSNKSHGMSKTPLYSVWCSILDRCKKPSTKGYENYGGRGISICEEWENSFSNFYDHISNLSNYREKGRTLDRIDNSIGYFPGNMQWSFSKAQNRNKRNNVYLTYQGTTKLLVEWAEEMDIPSGTLRTRIQRGWSIEKAISVPPP